MVRSNHYFRRKFSLRLYQVYGVIVISNSSCCPTIQSPSICRNTQGKCHFAFYSHMMRRVCHASNLYALHLEFCFGLNSCKHWFIRLCYDDTSGWGGKESSCLGFAWEPPIFGVRLSSWTWDNLRKVRMCSSTTLGSYPLLVGITTPFHTQAYETIVASNFPSCPLSCRRPISYFINQIVPSTSS